MYITIIGILLAVVAVLIFFDKEDKHVELLIYTAVVLLMFFIVAFRPIGIDKDSIMYTEMYSDPDFMVEPTFKWISSISSLVLGDVRGVFIMYALLAIPLKAWSIHKLSEYSLLAVLIWMGHFFIIHECTQIRAAVAVAIFLYAIRFLSEGKKKKYLLAIMVAMIFHYSSLLYLPLVFLGNSSLSTRWKYFLYLAPLIGYLLAILRIDLLELVPIPFFQDKIKVYQEMKDKGVMAGDDINIFNVAFLLKLLIYYFLLMKYEVIKDRARYMPIMLKIYAFSTLVFLLFSFMPVLAYRGSEMLAVVEIVLIPYLVYAVRPINVARLLVVLFVFAVFLQDVFYNNLLLQSVS